jgi:aspartate kinase
MSKKIIVNKFGGGIFKNELMPIIAKRIKEQLSSGYYPIVVVSAFPGITDKLISNTKNYTEEIKEEHHKIMIDMGFDKENLNKTQIELDKIFKGLDNKFIESIQNESPLKTALADEDRIVSCGEKLSATILSAYLNFIGIPSKRLLAEEIQIVTDNNFKNANIKYDISQRNINKKLLGMKEVPVIAGFTGITEDGETTTLGRGGTDTTACFIGASLKAEKIVLWKDVAGILSADPKRIKTAKTIPFINYFEAEEAGKVIHDKAIQYIKIHRTPIEITSIINPKLKTKIGEIKKMEKGAKIVSIKTDLDFILITDEKIKLNDLLLLVSETFKKYKVEITLISNTRYSLQIVAENKNNQLDKAYRELKDSVEKIEKTKANMIFLVGWFEAKDVSNFNDLLVKQKTDLLISAFYYENCYRMEAVIKTDDINKITKAVYKKFIR